MLAIRAPRQNARSLDYKQALHGIVEWYDRDCIKLTRQGSPNLMIFKRTIKYVHKEGGENGDES